MSLESLRAICRTLPEVTEDVKWGSDLCFSVSKKMFVVVNVDPPHQVAFKCTPKSFGELIERTGIIPAPYMARNMWVQEQELGGALDRSELEALVRRSYELVVEKLPKSKRPGQAAKQPQRRTAEQPERRTAKKRVTKRRASR